MDTAPAQSATPAESGRNELVGQAATDELKIEWDRKNSLEQRAITVVTTSGVLVTVVFGFTALVQKGTNFVALLDHQKVPLIISLCFFVASALLAVIVNAPAPYSAIRAGFLRLFLTPVPGEREAKAPAGMSEDTAGRYRNLSLTETRAAIIGQALTALRSARIANRRKAVFLFAAMCAEVAGVIALVITVAVLVAELHGCGHGASSCK
jgi:hypothetical protein